MSSIWYRIETCENLTDDGHFDPPRYLTLVELKSSTGVEIYKINTDDLENNIDYQLFKKERGYNYEDLLDVSLETMTEEEIETKLKTFSAEHLHEDDEVRLFLEGSGYFDIRDSQDNWIRIHVTKGDLLILPSGIYHRFSLGKEKYVKIRRLFSGFPAWTAKYRSDVETDTRR